MATRSFPITEPRALRRPRTRDWRLVAFVALILVSTAGIVNLLNRADDTRGVLVAARDLPAGTRLGPGDLVEARVRVDDRFYAAALPAAEAARLAGQTLTAPVYANLPLARAQLTGANRLEADQVAMTIAVKSEVAVGGRLRPGDEVLVLVTTDKGKPGVKTRVVLDRVRVYDVGFEERLRGIGAAGGSERDAGPLASLTLVLTHDQAGALAEAKWSGDLDVVLLPTVAAPGTR